MLEIGKIYRFNDRSELKHLANQYFYRIEDYHYTTVGPNPYKFSWENIDELAIRSYVIESKEKHAGSKLVFNFLA